MQKVKRTRKLIHERLKQIEYFYTLTSIKPLKNDSVRSESMIQPVFDSSLKVLENIFNDNAGTEYHFEYEQEDTEPIDIQSDNNKMIVCFSGGKDSLATALHYKNLGYNVILYHLRGINKCYPKEYIYAERLAEQLELPIVVENITLSGSHEWIEHPMKNMILANMALSYAVSEEHTTNIAFGNYLTSHLEDDPFEICSGDDVEMWDAYNSIVQTFIPNFQMNLVLTNILDSMECLVQHKDLIQNVSSCIGTHRFTSYYRRQNKSKYNVEIADNRCGSCWKCAYEYIYLTDNNVYEYNEGYYKHCMEVLRRTLKQETGRKYTLTDTWNHYFFYDISKSKYFTLM